MGGVTNRNMSSSLRKYNKLYIVASFRTIIDIDVTNSHHSLHTFTCRTRQFVLSLSSKHNIKDGDESKNFHLNLSGVTVFFNF